MSSTGAAARSRSTPRCARSPTPPRRTRTGATSARRHVRCTTATALLPRPRGLHRAAGAAVRPGLALRGDDPGCRQPRVVRVRDRHRRPGDLRARRHRRHPGGRHARRLAARRATAAASSCRSRDASGTGGTYGGGRYLLDTIKGADLGFDAGGEHPRARLQLRLQPVVRVRPRVGVPARARRRPR